MKKYLVLLLAVLVLSPATTGAVEGKTNQKPTSGASGGASAPKIDLNRASIADLEGVPGIGPRMAQAILDLRTKKGSFKQVEDLLEVTGIKEKKLTALAEYLEVLPTQSTTLAAPANQAPAR